MRDSKVQPIPEDYRSMTPWFNVKGVSPFIDFLKQAFGAVERDRFYNDDGTIGHA
jgi:PhnB protein